MNLSISEGINHDTFEKLVTAYNDLEEKGGQQMHIFLTSPGGDSMLGEAMIELINRYQTVTTLTAYSFIQSMGFDIFFKVQCPRVVLPSTVGMIHLHRWTIDIKDGGSDLDYFDTFKKNHMKKLLQPRIEFYRNLGITEKEIEWILGGDDLFVEASRIEKMLQIQAKNKK